MAPFFTLPSVAQAAARRRSDATANRQRGLNSFPWIVFPSLPRSFPACRNLWLPVSVRCPFSFALRVRMPFSPVFASTRTKRYNNQMCFAVTRKKSTQCRNKAENGNTRPFFSDSIYSRGNRTDKNVPPSRIIHTLCYGFPIPSANCFYASMGAREEKTGCERSRINNRAHDHHVRFFFADLLQNIFFTTVVFLTEPLSRKTETFRRNTKRGCPHVSNTRSHWQKKKDWGAESRRGENILRFRSAFSCLPL